MASQLYRTVITTGGESAVDVLAQLSGLPKARLKDAMNKGAVWLKRGSSTRRLRRATQTPAPGDELSLFYDPAVLALIPSAPQLLADEGQFSVWIKPAGLLAQGTQEGDHCCLLRCAELQLKREVFLVHRLDREAAGLMLLAHTRNAAAAFSKLFSRQDAAAGIRKVYQVEVRGEAPVNGEITLPLDGKEALTRFRRLSYDTTSNSSLVAVELVTGRKHQIRRHFAAQGLPVLGDPLHGVDNSDKRGLQLFAVELEFVYPLDRKPRHYHWRRD